MLILPTDGTTFQNNYRESFGKALGQALSEDASLTLVAQQAFDDYYLSETLFLLDEDYGADRVVRLEHATGLSGRIAFLCVDSDEFGRLYKEWPSNLPRPYLWRVPIISGSAPVIPPDVQILVPGTTQSAFTLTYAALMQSKETVILEHRELYNVEGYVDLEKRDELTRSQIQRVGADITIVASSWLLVEALQASEVLAEHGINAEVVDMRILRPLDKATIQNSIEKTKKGIVLDHMASLEPLRQYGLEQLGEVQFTSSLGESEKIGTVRIIRLAEKMLGKSPADLDKIQFFGYGRTFCGPF